MSNTNVTLAGGEARQSIIRVWLAISAIWVVFWVCIATLILVTGEMAGSLMLQVRLFLLIALAPPLALFLVLALVRGTFELLGPARSGRT